MKKIRRQFTIQLAFLFSVFFLSVPGIWSAGVYPESNEPVQTYVSLGHEKRKFRLIRTICESGCAETYESREGLQVTLIYACFVGSPEDVPAAMQGLMEEGRVLERSWRRTKRTGSVERTVVLYPRVGSEISSAAIFFYRPNEICFWQIEAESLRLALEFERSDQARKALLK